MAYMNQERKAKLAANLKKVMPQGWRYSVAVRNHSTLVLTISSAPFDLLGEWLRVVNQRRARNGDEPISRTGDTNLNEHHLESQFEGDLLDTMRAIHLALNDGNWNKSDVQSDYFNVGWYVDVNIGRWDKPFAAAGFSTTQH